MEPAYRDGDVIVVSPAAPVRRGDRVVVKTKKGEVMVKELKRQTAKTIELQSLNRGPSGACAAARRRGMDRPHRLGQPIARNGPSATRLFARDTDPHARFFQPALCGNRRAVAQERLSAADTVLLEFSHPPYRRSGKRHLSNLVQHASDDLSRVART